MRARELIAKGFEYAEHAYIGDYVSLTLEDGTPVLAKDHIFTLTNGLQVTFGQINGLAGDFYGTKYPISDGVDSKGNPSLTAQGANFKLAFAALDQKGTKMPDEATNILGLLSDEVAEINAAVKAGTDPSTVYAKLPDLSLSFYKGTLGRPDPQLNYAYLAAINWDHFGVDARTAFNAGHWTALNMAVTGDLERAYTMAAVRATSHLVDAGRLANLQFACHFLEDSFSAGHIRTPQRYLHKNGDPMADLSAKLMHDEENAIGLTVADPSQKSWPIYGDKRLLDFVDDENRARCLNAVQASVHEIYQAFNTKQTPQWPDYSAWQQAPVLPGSQANNQNLAALLRFDGYKRSDITHRCMDSTVTYTNNYWFWSTYAACQKSGLWKYPITMTCPQDEENGIMDTEKTMNSH